MAYVSAGWRLSVTLMDNGYDKVTKTYDLTSADATEAAADTATVIAALDPVTGCVIIEYHYYEVFNNNAVVDPAAGVQKEDQALLTFEVVGIPGKHVTHSIPAPVIGIFTAASGKGANIVDLTDNDLISYRALFQAGGVCTISDGETAAVLVSGKRRHVKNSKG